MSASATTPEPIYTDELPDRDTIRVTPALVRKLGPAGAIVFERIDFRQNARKAVEDENGRSWWLADLNTLAEDTGLSVHQVRRIIAKLVQDGHVERWKPYASQWDHTTAYSTVTGIRNTEGAEEHALERADSHASERVESHTSYLYEPNIEAEQKQGKAHSSPNGPASNAQRRFAKDASWLLSFSDGYASDEEQARAFRHIDSLTAEETDTYIKETWREVEQGYSFDRACLIDRDLARANLSASGFASVDRLGWLEPEGWRKAS